MKSSKPKTSGYEKTIEAINSTHDMPPQEAIDVLIACVKKGFSLASEKAVRTISKINHPTVIPSLIELYDWLEEDSRKRDNGCTVRMTIVEALGDTSATMTIDTIRKAIRTVHVTKIGVSLEDTAVGLRATAALALAKIDPDSLYELSLLLFDKKPDVPTSEPAYAKSSVRSAAARAIGFLRDTGGMPLLAVKLKFPDDEVPDVLAECLESLIFMRPPYLMEIVKPYLEGDDDYLSAIAALSLAENLGSEVLDLLLETFAHVSKEAKEAIVVAISATRCDKARQLLLDFLDHPDSFVRRGAVKGIKAYMDDEIKMKLQAIRDNDTDKYVRHEASLD